MAAPLIGETWTREETNEGAQPLAPADLMIEYTLSLYAILIQDGVGMRDQV